MIPNTDQLYVTCQDLAPNFYSLLRTDLTVTQNPKSAKGQPSPASQGPQMPNASVGQASIGRPHNTQTRAPKCMGFSVHPCALSNHFHAGMMRMVPVSVSIVDSSLILINRRSASGMAEPASYSARHSRSRVTGSLMSAET